MIILEFVVICAAIAAMAILLLNQIMAQVREYRFYKANGWDFSLDSGCDQLKLDTKIQIYDLSITNRQRFHIFRPVLIACISVFLLGMIWAGFFNAVPA